jgi:hypothetical protein
MLRSLRDQRQGFLLWSLEEMVAWLGLKLMKVLGALACLLLNFQIGQVTNAATPSSPISQADMARLFGQQLSLADEHAIRDLLFQKGGYVIADIGTKGGPIAGPVFQWSLSKDGILTATSEGVVQFRWAAIVFAQDGIWVRAGAKTEHYTIVKAQAKPN